MSYILSVFPVISVVSTLLVVAEDPNSLQGLGRFRLGLPIPKVSQDIISHFAKPDDEPKGKTFRIQDLPKESSDVVQGMVEAFLNKQQLEVGEVECLAEGCKDLSTDIMTVSEHIVMLSQKILGFRKGFLSRPASAREQHLISRVNTDSSVPVDVQYGGSLFAERRLANASDPGLLMSTSAVIMEFGFSLQKVAALSHQILHTCLEQDGLEALKLAAEHTSDISYLSQHLVSNGVDVCTELAEGAECWRKGDRLGFGHELGTALRKVFLSSQTFSGNQPKVPNVQAFANITEAFLGSFFGPGMSLDVQTVQGSHVDQSLHFDLHDCIGENAGLLEKTWASTMFIYGQEAKKRKEEHLGATDSHIPIKTNLGKFLAYDLVQLPGALKRCQIDDEHRSMIEDAILAIGSGEGAIFRLHSGRDAPTEADVLKQMTRTAQDWQRFLQKPEDSWAFGRNLGKLAQELTSAVFPEKYDLDSFGSLHQKIMPTPSSAGSALSSLATVGAVGVLLITFQLHYRQIPSTVAACDDEHSNGDDDHRADNLL